MRFFRISLFVGLLASATSALAQITFNPKGERLSLIPKSVAIDAVVRGSLCETTATYVFSNSGDENANYEVDFTYKTAPGQVITGFAYWMGDEKVPAYIVEKQRAANIYTAITSRQRDPALIERIDRETFRVRIFPVIGAKDLRIELKSVQTSVEGTFRTTIPADPRTPLESVKLTVKGLKDEGQSRWLNSWNLPITNGQIKFEKQQVIPPIEFRLTRQQQSGTIGYQSFGARSGGSSGYFVASLWPTGTQILKRPTIMGAKGRIVKLGKGWLVTGRYRHGTTPKVQVNGQLFAVILAPTAISNNGALKVWAFEEIEALGSKASNRAEIVQLSLRNGLPSRHTSWLAIPTAERKAFAYEIARTDLLGMIAEAARLKARGLGSSSRYHALTQNIVALKRKHKLSSEEVQWIAIDLAYNYASAYASRLVRETRTHELSAIKREYDALVATYGLRQLGSWKSVVSQACYNVSYEISTEYLKGEISEAKLDRITSMIKRVTGSDRTPYLYADYGVIYEAFETHYSHKWFGVGTGNQVATAQEVISRAKKRFKRDIEYADQDARTNVIVQTIGEPGRPFFAYTSEKPTAAQLTDVASQTGRVLQERFEHPEARLLAFTMIAASRLFAEVAHDEAIQFAKWNGEDEAKPKQVIPQAVADLGFGKNEVKLAYEIGLKPKYDELFGFYSHPFLDRPSIQSCENDLEKITQALELQDWRQFRNTYAPSYNRYSYHYYSYGGSYHSNEPYRTQYLNAIRNKVSPQELEAARKAFEQSMMYGQPEYDMKEYAISQRKLRMDILREEVLIDMLNQEPASPERDAKLVEMNKRREALRAKFGDPIILVRAPQHAKSAIAIFPDGEVKPLTWNASQQMWEVRFDIPCYFKQGQYDVKVVITMPDGRKEANTFSYTVDISAPEARAVWHVSKDKAILTVDCSEDTARVEVFLADGSRKSLTKRAPGRFEISLDLAESVGSCTIAVTDQAHNRTMFPTARP